MCDVRVFARQNNKGKSALDLAGNDEIKAKLRAAGADEAAEEKANAPYDGEPDALVKMCDTSSAPDIAKVNDLIQRGINLRYQVRCGGIKKKKRWLWLLLACTNSRGIADEGLKKQVNESIVVRLDVLCRGMMRRGVCVWQQPTNTRVLNGIHENVLTGSCIHSDHVVPFLLADS